MGTYRLEIVGILLGLLWISCAQDTGAFTQWTTWTDSPCPVTCGTAENIRYRTRICENGTCTGERIQTINTTCTRDCQNVFTPWSNWDNPSCSVTCGSGVRTLTRRRTCRVSSCSEDNVDRDVRFCNESSCPVDGGLSPWGAWIYTNCTEPCGTKFGVRLRYCNSPAPQFGGAECSGPRFETANEICNVQLCPDVFTPWGSWDNPSCSVTCGSGVRVVTRRRTCRVSSCSGNDQETEVRICNEVSCPDGFTPWGSWDNPSCSVTCGSGMRMLTRRRTCRVSSCSGSDQETEVRICDEGSCSDVFTPWGSWDNPSCSVTCGSGVRVVTRRRTCRVSSCSGNDQETEVRICDEGSCSDGFTPWGSWDNPSCSVTCGSGVRVVTRRRTCRVSSCSGSDQETEVRICDEGSCSDVFTPWGSWDNPSCSVTCGSGERVVTRRRTCRVSSCSGNDQETEVRICDEGPCSDGFTPWGSWDNPSCSVTCGSGVRVVTRRRTCRVSSCSGSDQETEVRICDEGSCSDVFTPWGSWDNPSCSVTCGSGERVVTRRRTCRVSSCSGNDQETEVRICDEGPCSDGFTPWGSWDNPSCSVTCGSGVRVVTRRRTCRVSSCSGSDQETEVRICDEGSCSDVFTPWGSWDNPSCSVTCGSGERVVTRRRTCRVSSCSGNDQETEVRICDEGPCSDGFTPWGSWDNPSCSVTCGSGMRVVTRRRTCRVSSCSGSDQETEVRICDEGSCSDVFTPWGSWDNPSCSVTCGSGERVVTRRRTCRVSSCSGNDQETEVRICDEGPCSDVFTPWGSWDNPSCSVTCGSGERVVTRRRTCRVSSCSGNDQETEVRICDEGSCSDGFTPWGSWDNPSCSVTCGSGMRVVTRRRTCRVSSCSGSDQETEVRICDEGSCSDVFTPWGSWDKTSCSVTCGSGMRMLTRRRTCRVSSCSGNDQETEVRNCTASSCPIDGGFSTWGAWQYWNCTGPCGTKFGYRIRSCNSPAPQFGGVDCSGPRYETTNETCNVHLCPANNTGLGPWSVWTGDPCNVTCGENATRYAYRTRSCVTPGSQCPGHKLETGVINCGLPSCSVDGVWTQWSSWKCTETCGSTAVGTVTRYRSCTNPSAQFGGRYCPGTAVEHSRQDCQLKKCPVNGAWTPWSTWMYFDCTATCGTGSTGKARRNRTCSNPAPQSGGWNCSGSDEESVTALCKLQTCPDTELSDRVRRIVTGVVIAIGIFLALIIILLIYLICRKRNTSGRRRYTKSGRPQTNRSAIHKPISSSVGGVSSSILKSSSGSLKEGSTSGTFSQSPFKKGEWNKSFSDPASQSGDYSQREFTILF